MARQETITCDICGDIAERECSQVKQDVVYREKKVYVTITMSYQSGIDVCRTCARVIVSEALNGHPED